MFNVVINNEQYDEYLAQKEKIKELETLLESVYKNYQSALSDKVALIEECNNLRIKNNELENKDIRFKEIVTENYRLRMSNNDLKENSKALKAEKEALLCECAQLESIKEAAEEKAALIKERDRLTNVVHKQGSDIISLRAKINDLNEQNKELKAKIKEPVASIAINPCRDSDEAYSLDSNRNINIENLYITNNYFSKEDEDNE